MTNTESILRDLVEIPSVTDDCEQNDRVLDYIQEFLVRREMQIDRRNYDGYGALVAATMACEDIKRPKLMLSAHADVVPGNDMFEMQEDGDKLRGVGVLDMKFAIASYLQMIDSLYQQGELHNHDFGVTVTTDEERQVLGVKNLLNDGFIPEAVVLPDGGVDWRMEKAAKGAWTTIATLPGKSAHGARPWMGESATFKLAPLMSEMIQLFEGQGPETDTLNISQISTEDNKINQIPAEAKVSFDIRVTSDGSYQRLKEQVVALYDKYGAQWEVSAFFPPLEHDLSNPYLKAFNEIVEDVTEKTYEPVVSVGASDAANYNEYGIPCVVVRPPGGGAHGADEWISREGLRQFDQVLSRFVIKMC